MQKAKNFNKQQISEEVDESSAPTSLIFVVCRLLFRYWLFVALISSL